MYKLKLALMVLLVCSLCIFYGCKGDSQSDTDTTTTAAAMTDDSGAYAKVNDVSISIDDFEQFAKAKRASQSEANFSDKDIIDEMIATELLRQEAVKQGIADRTDIIEKIKRQASHILINTLMTEKFAKLSFADEELKAEYDRLLSLSDTSEFKAKHILLQTEDDAKAVIVELNGGADFVALAKQKSQGPSAPNGGDLGWFKADTMVPPFATALLVMEKDSYSTTPVQTRFGWHVILLEDKRTPEQPAFEDVKQDLQRNLTQTTIESYVVKLQNSSTIVHPENYEGIDR